MRRILSIGLRVAMGLLWMSTPAFAKQTITLPTFTQQLIITSDATRKPVITILPVYDGKTWAFTARWDDNNPNQLNMQKAMASLGLKGTFYLNGSDTSRQLGGAYARQLSTEGCSVGGPHHPSLLAAHAQPQCHVR